MHDVVLKSVSVSELSNIGHHHRILAAHLQRILAGTLEIELRVRIDVVIEISDLYVAGRKNDIGLAECPHHIHGADLTRLQLVGIDIELNLPPRSAKRLRDSRA